MDRLPQPHLPFPDMTWLEQRQYLDARIWHSRELEICFVCEREFELEPYEGGFVCRSCKEELESVGDAAFLVQDDPELDILFES